MDAHVISPAKIGKKKLTQSTKDKFDKNRKDIRTTNNTHFPLTSNQTSSLFFLFAFSCDPRARNFQMSGRVQVT